MDDSQKLLAAAREAIRSRLEGRTARPFEPVGRAGPVFVTLRIDGALRGCMGALSAQFDDLVHEVMDRACTAAFEDPRFPVIAAAELEQCAIEITILDPLEPATEEQLDPARYGVEVSDAEGRRAVLLPGIESVDTVERQLELVRRKAGIAPDAPIGIRRFTVTHLGPV